ncbi:MAG: hypothetical protein QF398_02565 [Alphaproteobacteria bacterium]|nr:hypothetical protein [Alphaproteobacteria bacterium]
MDERVAGLTAAAVKAKARELGAALVGIADGEEMERHPPESAGGRRPSQVSELDHRRIAVLALPLPGGATRLGGWEQRHKMYNDELSHTALEEVALDLVYWLEAEGAPALVVSPSLIDARDATTDPTGPLLPLLSLDHAGVLAGLGTLGLAGQLVTAEYGPRVMLMGVMTSADVEADQPLQAALCQGPECGRCLTTCPADAVAGWGRDEAACDPLRHPNAFPQVAGFLERFANEDDKDKRKNMLRSEESFFHYQGLLRGVGVISGCRMCLDVCPVGADEIAELAAPTPAQKERLAIIAAAGVPEQSRRWVARVADG